MIEIAGRTKRKRHKDKDKDKDKDKTWAKEKRRYKLEAKGRREGREGETKCLTVSILCTLTATFWAHTK
jgi:hypothetical protein